MRNWWYNSCMKSSLILNLTAGWLRLKCEELGSRYRMPSKAGIAKNGRWRRQGGQGKGDGRLFERVRTLEIITHICWHFLQEHSSFGEHWLRWHGCARAWPAPCGQCWYGNNWCHIFGMKLTIQVSQGTCGKCPRHLGGLVETRSCKQLVSRFTGQARKVYRSYWPFYIFKRFFFRQDHSSRQGEGNLQWARLPESRHQLCIHPHQCPQ